MKKELQEKSKFLWEQYELYQGKWCQKRATEVLQVRYNISKKISDMNYKFIYNLFNNQK